MRKNLWLLVVVVLAGYSGFLIGEQKLKFEIRNWRVDVTTRQAPERTAADFGLFWTVWDKLNQQYVDKTKLDPQKMVEGAISGMVAAVGDPYTVFLPAVQNKEAKDELGGEFEGVGIQLGFKDSQLAVVSPLDGTPAKNAGVKPGDLIAHIKDVKKEIDRPTDGMTLPEAVNIIRGAKGTQVELTLIREGTSEPITVKLTRDTILVKSVTVEFKDLPAGRQVAVLKLNRFGDRTQDEWNDAVSKIQGSGSKVQGIVLDLRNNPGGYLDGAVYMAGEFLPAGKIVVTQQFGDGTKEDQKVDHNGRLLNTKLVVIINEGSASAAEILAGALADYKRAKIVGVKSFGKGSVQQPEDFPDGAGLHVTIAKWLRPSGEWIDKVGIKPEVEVKMDEKDESNDLQLKKAIELLK